MYRCQFIYFKVNYQYGNASYQKIMQYSGHTCSRVIGLFYESNTLARGHVDIKRMRDRLCETIFLLFNSFLQFSL